MRRRATNPLRRLRRAAAAPQPPASELSACVLCERDFVTPVEWEPVGEDRWWIFLRCGECGTSREVTVPNAVAERYDEDLSRGANAISRAAGRLDQERMSTYADTFILALRGGLIEPADFAR